MEIQVVRHARLSAGAIGYARRKLARLAHYSREPVTLARLTFTESAQPTRITVRAHLDVDGRPLVAHAEAEDPREAIDALDVRLRRRLLRMNNHWEARRGRTYRADSRFAARAAEAQPAAGVAADEGLIAEAP